MIERKLYLGDVVKYGDRFVTVLKSSPEGENEVQIESGDGCKPVERSELNVPSKEEKIAIWSSIMLS